MSIETGEAKLRKNGVTLTAEQEKKIDQLYKVSRKANDIKDFTGGMFMITIPLSLTTALLGVTSSVSAKRDRTIAEKTTNEETKMNCEESAKADEKLAKIYYAAAIGLPILNGIAYGGSALVEHHCENKASHMTAINQLQVDEVETTN